MCMCVNALVTVMVETENEEVEFLWKRFVVMLIVDVRTLFA